MSGHADMTLEELSHAVSNLEDMNKGLVNALEQVKHWLDNHGLDFPNPEACEVAFGSAVRAALAKAKGTQD